MSTGYEKIKEIIAARYNLEDWNIYLAQASDGDNYGSDNEKVTKLLAEDLLPVIQHFTYIEIEDGDRRDFMRTFGSMHSNLWQTIYPLADQFENVSCGKIDHERDVIRVFRNLFKKEQTS